MDTSIVMAGAGAVAGGALGLAFEFMAVLGGGVVAIAVRDPRIINKPTPVRTAFIGAALGASLGYGAGYGIDYLTTEPKDKSIIQECAAKLPQGKVMQITRDAVGNPVCTFQ